MTEIEKIKILINNKLQKQKKAMKNVRFFLTLFFVTYRVSAGCSKHKTAETNANIHIFLKTAKFFGKKLKKKSRRTVIRGIFSVAGARRKSGGVKKNLHASVFFP